MNQLQIEFHGICVHFSQQANPGLNLPAAHRVVLPFVEQPFTWHGMTIKVHEPSGSIQSSMGTTPLQPLFNTFTLNSLTQAGVNGTAPCVPPLLPIFPTMMIDPFVVVERVPPAGVYFDLNEGTLSGIDIDGSAATLVTIETEASEAVLTRTGFFGGVETTTIPLPATIKITNTAKDPNSDLFFDFIVSFAVGTPFPPPDDPTFLHDLQEALEAVRTCLELKDLPDLGPGCSNSQFP